MISYLRDRVSSKLIGLIYKVLSIVDSVPVRSTKSKVSFSKCYKVIYQRLKCFGGGGGGGRGFKKVIIIITTIIVIIMAILLFKPNNKLKGLDKLEKVRIYYEKDADIYKPYVIYLEENQKINFEDLSEYIKHVKHDEILSIYEYGEFRYSILEYHGNCIFLFFDKSDFVEAYIKVPREFTSLSEYIKNFNDGASWIEIHKLDNSLVLYKVNEKINISEHLLINGDILVIEYDRENYNEVISYKIYPKLAKKYLDVVKEILKNV